MQNKLYQKFFFTTLVVSLLTFSSQAQKKSGASFGKGTVLLNAGISVGPYHDYGYERRSNSGTPSLFISAEAGVHKYIGIGGFFGYYGRQYRTRYYGAYWVNPAGKPKYVYNYGDYYNFSYRFYSFGALVSGHLSPLINDLLDANINDATLDIYSNLYLGMEIAAYRSTDPYFDGAYGNSSRFVGGLTVGARYFFVPKLGAFVELGAGPVGIFTLGLTGKF